MADAIGSAYYELEARDSQARRTVDALESKIKASGASAESGFARPVEAATARARTGFEGVTTSAEAAGKALPTERVGGFRGVIEGLRGRLGEATDRVGGFASGLRDKLGGALDGARDKIGGFASSLTTSLSPALQSLSGPLGLAIGGGIAAGITGIAIAALGASAEMETYKTQFVTLLGSMEAADARIKELNDFAALTPFELPQVVQASRTLEVFTQGALSTGDSLRMIGDAAASVNVPFEEVAFWTGRLYAAMKGGQPIGEMTLRLSEMGILTPDTRAELEKLTKGIADGTMTMEEAWPRAEQAFGRFAGGMDRQSKTLSGQFSTFIDTVRMKLAEFGDIIAPLAKELLPALGSALGFLIDILATAARGAANLIDAFREAAGDIHFFAMNFGEQGDAVHATAERFGQDFDDLKDRIRDNMLETGNSFEEAHRVIVGELETAGAEAKAASWTMMQGILSSVHEGRAPIETEFRGTADFIPQSIKDRWEEVRTNAYQQQVEYAKGLLDGQNEVKVAIDATNQIIEEEMTEAEEIAYLKGQLASLAEARGLASAEGRVASVTAIDATTALIQGRLNELVNRGGAAGTAFVYAFADAVERSDWRAVNVASAMAAKVEGIMPRSEPRDPRSPFRGITTWGAKFVRTIADGIDAESWLFRDRVAALGVGLDPWGSGAARGFLSAPRAYELRIRHEIDDPKGALAAVPGGAPAVAGILARGVDASGLLRNVSHLAGVS